MKSTRYFAICILVSAIAALLISGCQRNGTTQTPSSESAVKLKQISVPTHVFSIAGEVLAFEAIGDANQAGEVALSLRRSQSRFGEFQSVRVYEYNREGKVLSQQEQKIASDAGIKFKAAAGHSYLIYPVLGDRFRNGYEVACTLTRAHLDPALVPRVCTQIFCGDNVFPASQLKERFPELKSQSGLGEFPDGPIGGFQGHGNICDRCLNPNGAPGGEFIPASGCSEHVSPDADIVESSDLLIYARENAITEAPERDQVFKIKGDGTNPHNLSNNPNYETSPDVNHKSKKIVFSSLGTGLTMMDLNGGNRTVIPNTILGSHPKWSRHDESFVIYTNLEGNVNNSLHRVHPDGSNDVVIVEADKDKIIRTGDVVDDDHVVFSLDGNAFGGDIFIKDLRNASAAINLTNTADKDETYPVISHDGKMIAFIVSHPATLEPDEIYVGRLELPGSITMLHIIRMNPPDGSYFRDLDFSSDDKRLFVAASVIETEGTENTYQLHCLYLDGTGQYSLTPRYESNKGPSAVAP